MARKKHAETAAEERKPVFTDIEVRAAKRPGYYKDTSTPNLWLQVSKSPKGAAKSWVYRYGFDGRRREAGLGGYPDVSLALARERAAAYRALLKVEKIDPIEHVRAQKEAKVAAKRAVVEADAAKKKAEAEAKVTFQKVCEEYVATHASSFSNRKSSQAWSGTLSKYCYPVMGTTPIKEIDTDLVMQCLQPSWGTANATMRRLRGRIEAVIDFAVVQKYRGEGLNPARWAGHLKVKLPKKGRKAKKPRRPSLPYSMLPAFMRRLRERKTVPAACVEFLIYTAARSGEARGATWGEIDLDQALWTIPAERMKMAEEHTVPLSKEAVELLKAQPRIDGNNLVFPALRGGVFNDYVLSRIMIAMNAEDDNKWVDPKQKAPAVIHGFRATFASWAQDLGNTDFETREASLAHAAGDVAAAYARSDLIAKRRKLMQRWADFVNQPEETGKVTSLAGRRRRA